MCIMRYSLGHGLLLLCKHIWVSPKKALKVVLCYVPIMALLGCIFVVRLHYGCVHWVNHKKREYSVSAAATAAVPVRRE